MSDEFKKMMIELVDNCSMKYTTNGKLSEFDKCFVDDIKQYINNMTDDDLKTAFSSIASIK